MQSEISHTHKNNTTKLPVLTEAGNDIFGTIQEVITALNNNHNTNWSKVNLEALRQHLLDMDDMIRNTKVIKQTPINNGIKILVQPTTPRAFESLSRVFNAHPVQLKLETGCEMNVKKQYKQYLLTITGNKADTNKIRGLGYIGLMAYGKHHQVHHISIATGQNPHKNYN